MTTPVGPAPPSEPHGGAPDLSGYPTVVEVEKRLSRSDYGGAVSVAFPLVMNDVQRAYALSYPRHWTARDVLAHALRPDMGALPDLLFQLYRLYEPVRFGREQDWVRGDVREILRRIYTETALRVRPPARPAQLVAFSVVPPRAEHAGPSGGAEPW